MLMLFAHIYAQPAEKRMEVHVGNTSKRAARRHIAGLPTRILSAAKDTLSCWSYVFQVDIKVKVPVVSPI